MCDKENLEFILIEIWSWLSMVYQNVIIETISISISKTASTALYQFTIAYNGQVSSKVPNTIMSNVSSILATVYRGQCSTTFRYA